MIVQIMISVGYHLFVIHNKELPTKLQVANKEIHKLS